MMYCRRTYQVTDWLHDWLWRDWQTGGPTVQLAMHFGVGGGVRNLLK
jgi:hypothetical protein